MGWQYLKILVAKWQRVKGLGGLSVIVNSGRCTCDDRVNGVTQTKMGDMAAALKASSDGSRERTLQGRSH